MREAAETLAVLLSLFAPYTAEEGWALLGHEPSVAKAGWPVADQALLVQDEVTCVVQVNGKVRDRLEVPPGISEDDLRELALAAPGIARALGGRGIAKVIVRAPKLVNIAVPAVVPRAWPGASPPSAGERPASGRGVWPRRWSRRLGASGARRAAILPSAPDVARAGGITQPRSPKYRRGVGVTNRTRRRSTTVTTPG